MKISIAYSSKFGNGKKCVEELGEILEKNKQEVKIFPIPETKPDSLPESDIYIFSSPVRQFVLPGETRQFLKGFKTSNKSARYALMTTHAMPKPMAFRKMDRLLKGKGLTKITNNFCSRVLGAEGPLEDTYRQKLKDFADEILKSC